ncbi:MAG TPA: hypothetical protein DCZ41_00385 [Firmicutes bacterium]|nr:hypothetical protein [Bacillota bacterium]
MKYLLSNIKIPLSAKEETLPEAIAKKIGLSPKSFSFEIVRRSIDARKQEGYWVYRVLLESKKPLFSKDAAPYLPEAPLLIEKKHWSYRPVVIGFGPAGLFASLVLARSGAKPIILERGKNVDERKKDIERLRNNGVFDPNSNVSYGEGGAGTFSDGKLNTGVKSPFAHFILEEFVKHGAPKAILIDAKPHIGSDLLPQIMTSFRKELLSLGADILFSSQLMDLEEKRNGLLLKYKGEDGLLHSLDTKTCFLAYGHSPFDTAKMLQKRGLAFVPKDYSIGVRLEVHQKDIDVSNYHENYGKTPLPSSSFQSVIHLSNGRSLYSFCMCPGGEVVNSSSDVGTVVTNGMSENARNKENGNAAMLVSLRVEDYFKGDMLDGYRYREYFEKKAFKREKPYFAPISRLRDFLDDRVSSHIGSVSPSYRPGFYFSDFKDCLPSFALHSLKEGLLSLMELQPFYKNDDIILTGVETRSSSPVRIPRNENYESNIHGLYPIGEGASFAGGITSAAIDGVKVALKVLDGLSI